MRRFSHRLLAIAGLSALGVGTAEAHIRLTEPTSRYGDEQKAPPCGRDGGERTDNVYTFEPGQTIDVSWDEYIEHPGHFRISFDADGDDDFVDPASFDDTYSNDAVLIDGIPDATGSYTESVTLPDVECDNCTLQVIQVMTDKPPYGDGNDIYYQCVDLVLERADAPGPDAGPGGGGGGGGDDDDLMPPSNPEVQGGCSVTLSPAEGQIGMLLILLGCGISAVITRRRRARDIARHRRGRN